MAGSPQPRPLSWRVQRPFPSGLSSRSGPRIPSPVSIPPCSRALSAPPLRAGSPARRERKVNRQPQPQRQITMRKINQEIAVRVPVPAAAPLSTRRDPNAGLPPRCVWGLAEQSLGSAGPWQGRGSGMNLGSGGTSTSATERFHTPRWPCVPTRLATRTLPPPGLLAGPLSLHLGASLSVSALISPSLSFDCPLLQARAPGPHRGCSPDAQTTAGQRPRAARPGANGRRESGRAKVPKPRWQRAAEARGPPRLPPAASTTWFQLARALRPLRVSNPSAHRVAEVCNLQSQPARGKRPRLPGLTSGLQAQVPSSR